MFTSVEHDELLKRSIVTSVEKHLDSVTAVLIHVDTTLFTSGSMDYVLSTLSTVLPKTLANNISVVFTNVSTPSLQGFSVPEVFKGAPTFAFGGDLFVGSQEFREVDEPLALGILAKLFNWMDSLNLQPATEITYLFEKHQHIKAWIHNTLTRMDQATDKKAKLDDLMTRLKEHSAVRLSPCSHLALESYACWT